MRPNTLLAPLACILLLLNACGGGGSSYGGGGGPAGPDGPAPGPGQPGAFQATLAYDVLNQRFNATWAASTGADRYRVLLKRTSADAFETLNDSISSFTPAYVFTTGFTVEWAAARLRVEACNASGCTAAPELPLLPYQANAIAQKNYQKSAIARPLEFFGYSVATSADGNTLAVGIPKSDANFLNIDTGSVQVFVHAGPTWLLQSTLTAPNMESGDQFGFGIALSGDGNTLAVAAPYEGGDNKSTADAPNNNAPRAGAVYVFTRDNIGAWDRHAAYLKASNAEGATAGQANGGDLFGYALGLSADGKTIAVGATFEDGDFHSHIDAALGNVDITNNAASEAGAAYVFTRSGANTWAQQAYLKASNAETGDQFAFSLSVSSDGNIVAVGAFEEDGSPADDGSPNNDHNGVEESGAAYVFARNGTQWSQQAYLKAARAVRLDWFGLGLALSERGDLLAVGAPFEMRSDGIKGGVVHVYSHGAGGWTLQSDLESVQSFNPVAAQFGLAMTFDGDGKTLAVTAPGANITQGQAYLFLRVGNEWRQQGAFTAGNPDVGDQYGVSIALSADTRRLFIGAAGESGDVNSTAGNPNNAAQAAGAVYVY
jgi:hypothetical protein